MPLSKLLLVLAAALLSGCSQIIPGLHVRAGEEGDHAYTEAPPTPVGVKPQPAKVQKYRVIQVNPEVVADLLELQHLAPTDAPPALPVVLPSDVPAEYRIGPGDVVFVTVWEHPELTMPYQGFQRDMAQEGRLVAADGSMYYPYVGTFLVSGMTAPSTRRSTSAWSPTAPRASRSPAR
jgi:polysaccharide export outer membrane protein